MSIKQHNINVYQTLYIDIEMPDEIQSAFENPFFLHEDQVLGHAQLSIAKHRHQKELWQLRKQMSHLQTNLKRGIHDMNNENKDLNQIMFDLKMQRLGKKDCLLPAIHSSKGVVIEAMRSFSFLENIKSVRREKNPDLPTKHRFVSKVQKKLDADHVTVCTKKFRQNKKKKEKLEVYESFDTEAVKEALTSIRTHSSYVGNGKLSKETAEKNLYNMLNRERNMNTKKVNKQKMKSLLETILVIQSDESYKLGNNTRW